MDLVSQLHSTTPVWEHFDFKPNERGDSINVNELVSRLPLRTVAAKSGNTGNRKTHLRLNHPIQFSEMGTKPAVGVGEGASQQLSVTSAFA